MEGLKRLSSLWLSMDGRIGNSEMWTGSRLNLGILHLVRLVDD